VDESLVHDVYGALFSPSVEKGIVDALSLIDYRKEQVYLRDSLYIPPSHRKVAGLMQTLHGSLRQITSPLVQAILWHYGFVTVHPYLDGNGRTARLLMNYRLLTAGLPWITILNDTRFAYFDSLSAAQVRRRHPAVRRVRPRLHRARRNRSHLSTASERPALRFTRTPRLHPCPPRTRNGRIATAGSLAWRVPAVGEHQRASKGMNRAQGSRQVSVHGAIAALESVRVMRRSVDESEAFGDRVIVKTAEAETQTASGIIWRTPPRRSGEGHGRCRW